MILKYCRHRNGIKINFTNGKTLNIFFFDQRDNREFKEYNDMIFERLEILFKNL
jgi:hypothetical protein